MKKIIGLLTSLIILLGLVACGNDEATDSTGDTTDDTPTTAWDRISEEGTLVVGTSGTYRPVTYYNEENTLTGYDVEVIRAIGDYLELDVQFETMDFDGILPALRNEQIDIAANDFTITDERLEIFDFTEPYKYSYGSIIIRREDYDNYEDANDLEGVPVALGSLTSNYARFAEEIGADGIAYDGGTEAILRDILNGNRDAYLNDRLVLARTVEEFGEDALIVHDQVKYHATTSAIPTLKGNDELVEKLNEAINALREDGTLERLSVEFLGEDASEPVDSADVVEFDI